MLPSKQENVTPGYEIQDHGTILTCTNITHNHKLRLTLIDKSKKPNKLSKS